MTEGKWIIVQRARFVPVILLVIAVWIGLHDSLWWLVSIPFIIIGWLFCSPNLNLADGCLSYFSIFVGIIIVMFHQQLGLSIFVGTAGSFYLSALEMRLLAKPYKVPKNNNGKSE